MSIGTTIFGSGETDLYIPIHKIHAVEAEAAIMKYITVLAFLLPNSITGYLVSGVAKGKGRMGM